MWRVVLLSWWLLGTLAFCCPPDCRCFTDDDGSKVANCSKTGLLSGGYFPTIDVLNFKNQLRGSQTKLEARIFRNFRGLQVVNLRNSSITHLPNDVFLGLTRVFRIDLSFNKIKHLNGVVFKPLPSLKELNLRGNSLIMSPLEVIVSDTLEELDMGYCNINSLPLYTFMSVPSLRHLVLDGNSIQTIEYNVLPKGLTYVNLANNHIVEPPINVFNSLRYLFRLDLSNNPVNCSCALLAFQDSLSGRAGLLENGVTCANPPHLTGRSIDSVNENQLCRDDYNKVEGSNSLLHSRRSRYRHHHYDIQSDEPLMGDESYGSRAAEVMFTNDETNQMGTHMEARMGTFPESYSEPTEDNIHSETTKGETDVPEKVETSPEVDPSQDSTEVSEIGKTSPDVGSPEALSESDHQHSTAPEDGNENSLTGQEEHSETITPDEPSHTPENSVITSESLHTAEDSYSGNDNVITLSTSDPSEGTSDHSNTLHALDVGYNTTDSFGHESKTSEIDESEEHTTELDTGVEVLSNTTLGDSPSSHLELFYDDTTTDSSSRTSDNRFTLPTSATEPSDYSYDTQHDEYGYFDNATSSEVSVAFSQTGSNQASSSTSEMPELETEGSGEMETETQESSSPSSTVGFMEEHEPETESSLLTVSDDLVDMSSTTSYEGLLLSSSTDMSTSVEPSAEPSTESSSDPSIDTFEPSSSETPSTESSADASSSEYSTEHTTASSPYSSSTDQSSTAEDVTEQHTLESSVEPSTEPTSEPASTEPSTELPAVEISSEASSTESTSGMTDLSSTSEVYSSTSESSRGFWWEDTDEIASSSSSATPVDVSSSSLATPHRENKMVKFTTESDEYNEIDVISTFKDNEKNGKISVSPNRTEDNKNILSSGITFILIGCLLAIVLVLLTIIVCRKKRLTKKVRLPVDAEAANGTELQDMLLPKPPENGVKVLPKAYTNGSTPVSNGKAKEPEGEKEETIPVLTHEPDPEPEPEPVWEDKPEPIEAVTARLTMLARPQTPIFIQKTLT